MEHFSPVQIASLQAHDEHFSRGQIGGDGHIVLVAMADGLDHLAVVPGLGGVGVGKQQDQVDLVIGNPGVDLLMAALFVRKQQGNGQTGIVCDQPTGSGGGEQVVFDKNALIGSTELYHQFFFLVVCQECEVHCSHSFT